MVKTGTTLHWTPNIAFEADAVTRRKRSAALSVAGAAQLKR